MKNLTLFLMLLLFNLHLLSQPVKYTIYSPDNRIKTEFRISEPDHSLLYNISYEGKPAVLESLTGISSNGIDWNRDLTIGKVVLSQHDSVWEPLYGERAVIRDNYKEMVITLQKGSGQKRTLNFIVRAYNEGTAFRYNFPDPGNRMDIHITGESTDFSFPENTMAWFTSRAQTLHEFRPLKDWPGESDRPLTLELPSGLYVSLLEAEMVNYARTKFRLSATRPNTLACSLYDIVDEIATFNTPWRVIMIADSPAKLLQNNDLILNLNPPCAIKDISWIKPGKAMRCGNLSTVGGKSVVDFAAAHGIDYVHFDGGWFRDPETLVENYFQPRKGLNIEEVAAYAKTKNIGVILYIERKPMVEYLDSLLPLYKKWGVSGIKFGFVQVGSHRWTTWLHEAVKKCAKYNLIVDIHDEYRPTGFSRTYPNLLTQEGIRGNEEMPDANNNTILPFTRFLAGPADYTFCYYTRKEFGATTKFIMNTPAHQLALPVVYYSPLQYLFWYDSPASYKGEPEIEFWDQLPVTWDDTRVLGGAPGKYISVARKNNDRWFLGTITNTEAREIRVKLDFLDPGKNYEMITYYDDPAVKTRTHVGIRKSKVTNKSELKIKLGASSGEACLLVPMND